MNFKFSKRVRNGKTYVTIKKDCAGYAVLCAELKKKYPSIRATSGGISSVTGVIE